MNKNPEHRSDQFNKLVDCIATMIVSGICTSALLATANRATAKEMSPATGLLEHAMIGKRLCYPDRSIGALAVKQAKPGAFISYDFKRAERLPATAAAAPQLLFEEREGIIWSFMPESVKDQPSSVPTPTRHPGNMSYEDRRTIGVRAVKELIEDGVLIGRTQEQAYEHAGASEFIDGLRMRSVANDPVLQVTPKGNSLITLVPNDHDYAIMSSARWPSLEPLIAPGVFAH